MPSNVFQQRCLPPPPSPAAAAAMAATTEAVSPTSLAAAVGSALYLFAEHFFSA